VRHRFDDVLRRDIAVQTFCAASPQIACLLKKASSRHTGSTGKAEKLQLSRSATIRLLFEAEPPVSHGVRGRFPAADE
jgi:hypothetical protein